MSLFLKRIISLILESGALLHSYFPAFLENKHLQRNQTIHFEHLEIEILYKNYPYDKELLDSIVALIVETMCSKRKQIRIAGDDKPVEIVRSRFMKLNSEHIKFVMDCFKENTTKIRNIKQYLLAAIYNSILTIDGYFDALVRHDLSEG